LDDWTFVKSVGRVITIDLRFDDTLAPGTQVFLAAFWFNGRKQCGALSAPISFNLPGGGVAMRSGLAIAAGSGRCDGARESGYDAVMSEVQVDPDILGGTPCFRGTRVPVETLIDYLLHGYTVDYFLSQFPTVSREQVKSVLESFKSDIAHEASKK